MQPKYDLMIVDNNNLPVSRISGVPESFLETKALPQGKHRAYRYWLSTAANRDGILSFTQYLEIIEDAGEYRNI